MIAGELVDNSLLLFTLPSLFSSSNFSLILSGFSLSAFSFALSAFSFALSAFSSLDGFSEFSSEDFSFEPLPSSSGSLSSVSVGLDAVVGSLSLFDSGLPVIMKIRISFLFYLT